MNLKKILILALVALLLSLFFFFDLGRFLTLDYFSQQKAALESYYQAHPWQSLGSYFLIYVLVTGLSLPGAAVLTLVGGALFGLWYGLLVVSFASTIGATLAFLVSRTLLRDWVQGRFEQNLKSINQGIAKEGAFYLFTLRLVPVFPFFIINLVMGLTPIRVLTFFVVSQIGMLPGTLVYVNAGTQLGQIESVGGILSPALIASFVLLGLFPLLAKKIIGWVQARKVLKGYAKPKKFDTNLVVIGAGSGGLVSAYIAAAVKAKVTLIEKDKMGGDCLNTGCVPSKALIRSAKVAHLLKRSAEFGIQSGPSQIDFDAVMGRVQRVIKEVEPHDSVERYTGLGVDCLTGKAQITSPYSVRVGDREITTPRIIIATGGRPAVPTIEGIDRVGYLTSDTVWQLQTLPKRLLVIGSGPIGCELAQSFARLGSEVTLLNRSARMLPKEDEDVSAYMRARMSEDGIRLCLGYQPEQFGMGEGGKYLDTRYEGNAARLEFDELLVAVGRQANTEGLGLETLGIERTPSGTVQVNEYMQTRIPTIYACGDVAGPFQFTHTASHQAWYAVVNALFGRFKKFKVDYRVIPWATFTDPEVARVGLNEREAKVQGIAYEITHYEIEESDRAIADGENRGFVKVLTVPGKDKILGVTLVGYHASELITEFILAMKHGIGLNKILGTIHIYPTLSEINKAAAGNWKRAHAPAKLLDIVARFHTMVRGA